MKNFFITNSSIKKVNLSVNLLTPADLLQRSRNGRFNFITTAFDRDGSQSIAFRYAVRVRAECIQWMHVSEACSSEATRCNLLQPGRGTKCRHLLVYQTRCNSSAIWSLVSVVTPASREASVVRYVEG